MDPEGMDPGERITGTRDEHYDLISAAYHALQGAEACDTYALDAEATGRTDLAGFFRETQVVYAGVAERAKELLGNTLAVAGATPVDATPVGEDILLEEEVILAEEEAAVLTEEEVVLPEEAPPEEAITPEAPVPEVPAAAPGTAAAPEAATPGAAVPEASATTPGAPGITTADIDATVSALRDGVAGLDIERSLAEIEDWRARLEGSGEPDLVRVAENLRRLSALLSADTMDATAVGELLKHLGGQVQHVADTEMSQVGDIGAVSDRLKALGGSLASEGDSISGR